MKLADQTTQEKITFEQPVILKSGDKYDHRKKLTKINLHKRGKFYNCDDPDAVFWPLGQEKQPHFAKKLDLDTKHFLVEGRGDFNYYQAWATNVRFRKWAKDTAFSKDLDDLGDGCTDFGSSIMKLPLKKGDGYDFQETDLMKMWFDPTIDTIYGNTKFELHELYKTDLLDMEGWQNVDKSWEKAEIVDNEETKKHDTTDQLTSKRKYWERVGYYNVANYTKGDLVNGEYQDNNEKEDYKFMHTIHSGEGNGEVVVFAEEIDKEDDVYIDFHISKYEDRWMRIGVFERLEDLQKMINETVNYDRQAQQIASLLLVGTKNKRFVGSNILQEAVSGLITDADFQQIPMSNGTTLQDLSVKLQAIESKADLLCLTPDVAKGSDPDIKTFRGQAAALNANNSAFKSMRNRISLKVGKLLIDKILPHEIKGWNKEKSMEVAGFDIDNKVFDVIAKRSKLTEYIEDYWATNEKNPTEEQKARFLEDLINKYDVEGRKMKLPKDFFDFEFGLGLNPVGEVENKDQMNDTYSNALDRFERNPNIINIPLFREYLEKNNVAPFHVTNEEIQQFQQGQQANAPAPPPTSGQDKLMSTIDSQ